jgi:predicted CXXCH cytochrome family protein
MSARLPLVLVVALLLAACAGVLGLRREPSHPFEHRAHVLKGIGCLDCHQGVAEAGEKDALHFPKTADCVRCHTKPHDERTCDNCHGESHVRGGAELARIHLKFEHRTHMPAAQGDCVRCHVEIGVEKPEVLRPKMAICFGCHQHEDQWRTRDCDGCHVELAAENTLPSSHLVHSGDFVREHGIRAASARDLCASCHSERHCAGCHGVGVVPALPGRLAFDNVRLTGLHRAGFRARHSIEAKAQSGLCTTCHSERSCFDCHTALGVAGDNAKKSPHPPGWLTTSRGGGQHGTQARLDPFSCASCHGGAGEQLCVDCHRVGGPGGNPHGRGFESTKDKLVDVPCRLCHAGVP